jgi:hypothetical protein
MGGGSCDPDPFPGQIQTIEFASYSLPQLHEKLDTLKSSDNQARSF